MPSVVLLTALLLIKQAPLVHTASTPALVACCKNLPARWRWPCCWRQRLDCRCLNQWCARWEGRRHALSLSLSVPRLSWMAVASSGASSPESAGATQWVRASVNGGCAHSNLLRVSFSTPDSAAISQGLPAAAHPGGVKHVGWYDGSRTWL